MVRLALCCLLLFSLGCERGPSNTIVFALSNAPGVLDPRLASDAASERVNALLFDRLVRLDAQGRPQAAMAGWTQETPRRFRFTLDPQRSSFPDGTQPQAKDVVATYETLLGEGFGSPHAGALAHLTSIRALSETEILFELSRPDPRFPARATIGILPAARAEDQDFSRRPVGSGPFGFESWRDDGGLVLRRRRDGQAVAFVPVPDPTMRALKLIRGEAQMVQNDLPAEIVDYLAQQQGMVIEEEAGSTFAYIGFNLTDPVLSQPGIRRAIAHAVDREAIIRHLFAGRARLAESVIRRGHWAGAPQLQGVPFDPAISRTLLARLGYGPDRPLQISYKTSTDPFRLRIAHVLQSQLSAVGIQLEISSYDWGTFFGDIKAGRFQMYSLAWVGVNSPDILRYAFHSESLPPDGANRGRYRSTVVDELIETAEQEPAETARRRYARIQQLIHDDLVYVPLWYENNVAIMRGVADYRPGYDGNYLALEKARLDERP